MDDSRSEQDDLLDDIVRDLSDRAWAVAKISAWVSDPGAAPALLIRGSPGSGKSTLLAMYLASLAAARRATGNAPRVIATILRHPQYLQPFDSTHFLSEVVNGLADFAPAMNDPQLEVGSLPQITVTQNIGQVEKATGVVIHLGIQGTSSLRALAEQRVRATPESVRALIVIDALDQAEDEGADEFLRTVTALARAADGTGVRILCTSRTMIPVWLDPSRRVDIDLVEDADDLDAELREYLRERFAQLDSADRGRIVDALVTGAQGNWLWASTNASALEHEIAVSHIVPDHIALSEGLSGLYSDGWLRIRQRLASHHAELQVKRILGVVACSFTGSLGVPEIRWATDIAPDDISRLVHECEPFLAFDGASNVRVFHPDFSRWLFRSDDVGLSESSEHLRLARGLTRFGKTVRWKQGAEAYATNWVLDHWCQVRILDPFRPDAVSDEEELEAIIADPDWGARSGASLETIAQLGLVARKVRFPGHEFPLSVGLRALQSSAVVNDYALCRMLSDLQEHEITELLAATDGYFKWLEVNLHDFSARKSRAMWGGLLAKRFHIAQDETGIVMALRASAVIDLLTSGSQRIGYDGWLVSELAASVARGDRPALLEGLRALLLPGSPGWIMTAKVNRAIGQTYRAQAAERPPQERAADLEQALAAYNDAWLAVPPGSEDRLTYAIDLANTLRELPQRSAEQLQLLVTAQTEIRDLRRAADDAAWPGSANWLGDAYRERAGTQVDESSRDEDIVLALVAYTQAWQAVPADHKDRLTFAIDLANTLRELPQRSAEQLQLLVTAQAEVRDLRHAGNDPDWPRSANMLGDAYRERAGTQVDESSRDGDVVLALVAYTQAWLAVPPGHEDRQTYAIDLANTLRELPQRSPAQLELLVTAQTEVRDLRMAADDPDWPRSANLLGDAYREHAGTQADESARDEDIVLALAAYTQAWQAVPADHKDRQVYAIDLANTLRELPQRSAEQLQLLVTAQTDIRDLRMAADDPDWPRSADLLGDAYRERAGTRVEESDRDEDMALALAAYTQAWQAVPADHKDRLTYAIDLANTLLKLRHLSAAQAELLVTVQTEICDLRRAADDPDWPRSVDLLGDAYRGRAGTRVEESDRDEDMALALAAYTQAWQAVPPGHEDRLTYAIDLTNTLLELPERSAAQAELLVTAQTEIRDLRYAANHPAWPMASDLLGEAFRARAKAQDNDDARAEDMALALAAYTQAWEAVPADHKDRLTYAVDLANTLLQLPQRSAEQVELLITLGTDIRDRHRGADNPAWPRSANLLGDMYQARAAIRTEEGARREDLLLAAGAYTEAWHAVAVEHEDRLMFAVDLADTLLKLRHLSATQAELLVTVQTEIRDLRHAGNDPDWPRSANLLGDAYRERADTQTDESARKKDLALAVAAHTEAWRAVPAGHEDRLIYAVDLANTLLGLPALSTEEAELLVAAQGEIRDLRKAADDPRWPLSANLLGRAYRERAETRTDLDAREDDLALAVAAYSEAWQATAADHQDRLRYAIDLANTLVVQAAIRPTGTMESGRAVIDQALELVSSAVKGRQADNLTELRELLPVLSVQLVRQQWSWI